MKKNLLLIVFILFVTGLCRAQFTTPAGQVPMACEVNVNDRPDQNFRDDIKRAIFKYSLSIDGQGFSCSGTLINRNTSQGDLGQYFISAWHCFKSSTGLNGCAGDEFDFANNNITMVFNYQSPPTNPGQVFTQNADGSVYQITRQVRLVDKVECAYGDFALCQILGDPIPSYFNVYYAGWYPTDLLINTNGAFAAIHHPLGSIKKISGSNTLINNSGGVIATGCKTITKLIDFLFGWIWGHRWSTQVVCTYLEVPYAGTRYTMVDPLTFGKFEDGSSGGGLFTGTAGTAGVNRHIGQLSGVFGGNSCNSSDAAIDEFGKLSDVYYRQTIKNTMNPPNSYWTDQGGIGGRQISCYPQINLNPGAGDPPYDLYPASYYQADNQIILTAQTSFTAGGSGNVTVKQGADFVFQAGQTITLNPGFQTEAGANFQATVISACSIDGVASYNAPPSHAIPNKLNDSTRADSLQLIPQKKFDINKYLGTGIGQSGNVTKFNVYPNPTTGIVNMELFLKAQEPSLVMTLYDLYGRAVFTKNFKNVYFIQEQIDLPSLPAGMYSLAVRTSSNVYSKKIVLIH